MINKKASGSDGKEKIAISPNQIQSLNDLIQLDVDAYFAYSQAVEHLEDAAIKKTLLDFRGDHERHINTLSDYVRQAGSTPTSFGRDFKGFLISGYTAVRSSVSAIGPLKAMQTNETITTTKYEQALSLDMPTAIKNTIRKNYEDEERHIKTINKLIEKQEQK